MRRTRIILLAILLALLGASMLLAWRLGDIPMAVGRAMPLDLGAPDQLFRDWRIAALTTDRDLCTRVLAAPLVQASAVNDQPMKDGCGWTNAVRVSASGGASIAADPLSCPAAAALTLWLAHEVQPAAMRLLGRKVGAVKTLGSYSCRGINGNAYADRLRALHLPVPRSEHATANAIDIAVFELDNGDSVSVLKDWPGSGPKANFLRSVHEGACRFFRVVLGPGANAAHANHFHLDRGPWRACE